MGRRFSFVVAFAVCLACGALKVAAHSNPNAPVPSLQAVSTDAPITVDGVLDEPFWKEASVGTGFVDMRSHQLATNQSTIRVAFTPTHMYVAMECLDDHPEGIVATERREDRVFSGDDWVEVHFDPPHNHRGKYAFFVNPLGTRADANEGPSGQFNYGWSAEWEAAAKILGDRWVFEMKIPLKVLNYQRKDGLTWGFNVTRLQRRTDVTSFWSFSATDMYKPRHFGHLTNVNLGKAVFDRNWEATPYLSTRVDFNGQTEAVVKGGVDASVRLTPSITSAITITPDYGQIEADDDTIELRDTERFLSEKRPFFREGEEIIRMPHQMYYSRRFTDIDAGLKASGVLPGYSFAFQDLYGDVVHDGKFYGNSALLRVMQDVKERSYLGYYVADSEMEEGHSRVASADGYFFLTDKWRARFQGAVADDVLRPINNQPYRDSVDYLGHASLIYYTYPWNVSLSYDAITDQFNPLLGYIPRRDIFGPTFFADYHRDSGKSWYKSYTIDYTGKYFWNDESNTSLRDHGFWGNLVFANNLGVRLGYDDQYHAPYHNRRTSVGTDIFASDYYKAINLTYAVGEFELTDYHELSVGKRYKFWERLPIRHEFVVRYEDRPSGETATVWLNRIVFDLFLTDNMWIKTSIQHRQNGVHNVSVIYGWKVRPNINWYIVFNNVDEGGNMENSVMTKLTYTFR